MVKYVRMSFTTFAVPCCVCPADGWDQMTPDTLKHDSGSPFIVHWLMSVCARLRGSCVTAAGYDPGWPSSVSSGSTGAKDSGEMKGWLRRSGTQQGGSGAGQPGVTRTMGRVVTSAVQRCDVYTGVMTLRVTA